MALRPIPNLLRKQIEFANIIPPPKKLSGADDEGGWVREHWDSDETQVEALKKKSKQFRQYMEGADLEKSPAEFVRRCEALKMTRELLHTIARTSKNALPGRRLPVRSSFQDQLVSVVPDQDGNLQIDHHPLLQALEGVEVSRIRECEVCHQIFWAQRTDQHCCGRRCAHVLRTRRWREEYDRKYHLQRVRKANAKEAKVKTDEVLERGRVEILESDIRRAKQSRRRNE
jgi:hypothetical protein